MFSVTLTYTSEIFFYSARKPFLSGHLSVPKHKGVINADNVTGVGFAKLELALLLASFYYPKENIQAVHKKIVFHL